MKIFTSKSFKQKLIISIICITILEFCCIPFINITKAANDDDIFGGKIMSLVRDFLTGLADAAAGLVQYGVTGEWSNAVDKPGSGIPANEDGYFIKKDKFKYPILRISPELIFANQVELLDVNFISPMGSKAYAIPLQSNAPLKTLRGIVAGWYVTLRTMATVGLLSVLLYIGIRIMISSTSSDKAKYKQRLVDWIVAFCLLFFMHYIMAAVVTVVDRVNKVLGEVAGVDKGLALIEDYGNVEYKEGGNASDSNEGPSLEPEERPEAPGSGTINNGTEFTISGDTDEKVRDNIIAQAESAWGSKCTNSDTSYAMGVPSDDGTIISTCELTFENGEKITIFKRSTPYIDNSNGPDMAETKYRATYTYTIHNSANTGTTLNNGTTSRSSNIQGAENSNIRANSSKRPGEFGSGNVGSGHMSKISTKSYQDSGHIRFFTNYVRLYLNVKNDNEYLAQSTAYLILYIALITLTAVFTIRYIKRLIYIAFLTLMAPMVALTYPLDKIKDGKAQAWNMWFKEYIFNIIIQPVHLLLYVVLIGSAIELARNSLIYAVVAMYFMTPAEKLIRKFFGFDNAGTLSAAGSFAGGALFSAMINKMSKPKAGNDRDDDDNKGQNTRKPTKGVFNGTTDQEQIFGRQLPNANNRSRRTVVGQGGSGNNRTN